MAYPMIALTTAGTTFACASVSLTETGLAVLNESGSRTGFVPYDSLEYVAPTEEAAVSDPPMRILTEDGSSFGAASISQASAGVAVLDASGARIGFVPYDTLTYVLPEAKTGPTLPADATPVDGVNIDEEDDGGSPVWDDGEDDADDECGDGKEDADGGEEDDADGDEDTDGDEGSDGDADEGGSDGDECEDADGGEEDGSDGGEEDADSGGEEDDGEDGESADEDDEPVWGDDPVEESERGDGADDGSSDDASGDEESHAEDGEREEVEESELVVEWSFGDDE